MKQDWSGLLEPLEAAFKGPDHKPVDVVYVREEDDQVKLSVHLLGHDADVHYLSLTREQAKELARDLVDAL